MSNENESKWEKFNQRLNLGEVNNERKDIIRKLIKSYEEICEYDGEKLGTVNNVKHKIEIKEGQEPIAQKRNKETDEKGKFIKKEIKKMLKMGRKRKSWSPW